MKPSVSRAKARKIIKELKLRKCDNFKPVGVSVPYAVSNKRKKTVNCAVHCGTPMVPVQQLAPSFANFHGKRTILRCPCCPRVAFVYDSERRDPIRCRICRRTTDTMQGLCRKCAKEYRKRHPH